MKNCWKFEHAMPNVMIFHVPKPSIPHGNTCFGRMEERPFCRFLWPHNPFQRIDLRQRKITPAAFEVAGLFIGI
jgi:hypothetical protein